jgi:hypothetical protein
LYYIIYYNNIAIIIIIITKIARRVPTTGDAHTHRERERDTHRERHTHTEREREAHRERSLSYLFLLAVETEMSAIAVNNTSLYPSFHISVRV